MTRLAHRFGSHFEWIVRRRNFFKRRRKLRERYRRNELRGDLAEWIDLGNHRRSLSEDADRRGESWEDQARLQGHGVDDKGLEYPSDKTENLKDGNLLGVPEEGGRIEACPSAAALGTNFQGGWVQLQPLCGASPTKAAAERWRCARASHA